MRMREELQQNNLKAKLHQAKYNAARTALLMLVGTDEEGFEWKEMRDSDIWCMQDPKQGEKRHKEKKESTLEQRNTENLDGPGVGEGYQWVSWIWESAGANADGETGMRDGKLTLVIYRTAHYSFPGL